MDTIIAVDAGGTQLRAALYAGDQLQPLKVKKIATRASEPNTFGRLVDLIKEMLPAGEKAAAIGVSVPGPVVPQTGDVMFTPNIPEWQNYPITSKLSAEFNIPCVVGNDANLACLAEWKFGAARGHHNVLYLTVSTGVGGGVIVNDQLMQGEHGLGAELGHTILDPEGPLCGCGKRGHLEAYSSGTGIERCVAEQLTAGRASSLDPQKKNSAREISAAASLGDALSVEAYQIAGKYLGIGVVNFLHAFDPSIVVFGGGVWQSGKLLMDAFQTSLRERIVHPKYIEELVIASAELGDDSGLLGARALAELKLKN